MATSAATIEYLLDQMSGEKVSARKMFGEYALYSEGRVVGLVYDDTLFIKITEPGKTFVEDHYEEGPAYPGAKPSMVIPEERIEDRDWLSELIRITTEHVPLPKPKKKK